MKPRHYRSVSNKGAGRPCLTHHHKGWWNETKWMRWVWRNGGMKSVVGVIGRNPMKNLPRPRFVHHETHMEWPRRELGTPAVGGERLTACTTRPPKFYLFYIIVWHIAYECKVCVNNYGSHNIRRFLSSSIISAHTELGIRMNRACNMLENITRSNLARRHQVTKQS